MYLNLKYIVLIVLMSRCLTIYTLIHDMANILDLNDLPVGNHCSILFPIVDKHMPIPYQPNITGAAIINPDKNGNLFIAYEERFQLSCSDNIFVSPTVCVGKSEVTVKCLGGVAVSYKGKRYKFNMFRCSEVPKAKLMAANKTCNGIENRVFNVGFKTRVSLTLYKVCFNAEIKHTLYAWNYINAPTYKSVQTSKLVPKFIKTKHFKDLNMDMVYDLQKTSVTKSFNSTISNSSKLIGLSIGLFLTPTQLLPRDQFYYVFQQHATYFYENTAPNWSVFNRGVWFDVEKVVWRVLNKFSGKFLIVSGSYNSTYLTSSKTIPKDPFTINWPNKIPVPLYMWKMVYNISEKKGIVFIGMNNPFKKIKSMVRFCKEIPCPNNYGRSTAGIQVIFCCSKESFEKVYGQIDPVVFKQF